MVKTDTKDLVSREKYMNHSTSSSMVKSYLSMGGRNNVLSLPICPKCERLGLRDKGWTTVS